MVNFRQVKAWLFLLDAHAAYGTSRGMKILCLLLLASRRTDRFYFAIEEAVRLRFKRFRADKTSACLRINQAALHNALRAIRAAGLLASASLCLINSPPQVTPKRRGAALLSFFRVLFSG